METHLPLRPAREQSLLHTLLTSHEDVEPCRHRAGVEGVLHGKQGYIARAVCDVPFLAVKRMVLESKNKVRLQSGVAQCALVLKSVLRVGWPEAAAHCVTTSGGGPGRAPSNSDPAGCHALPPLARPFFDSDSSQLPISSPLSSTNGKSISDFLAEGAHCACIGKPMASDSHIPVARQRRRPSPQPLMSWRAHECLWQRVPWRRRTIVVDILSMIARSL
ncbi:hypothetical protein NDU88_005012 [Pleurodeles waltl]|uniref:Uncharacterized protein n=1 Tax=Pleurodeles waltl TaxID=8319 RepID=A0AAV7TAR8_PLEWA|nr:hypothetical protein NDU88_005012 [Pleurodeles waltl]